MFTKKYILSIEIKKKNTPFEVYTVIWKQSVIEAIHCLINLVNVSKLKLNCIQTIWGAGQEYVKMSDSLP